MGVVLASFLYFAFRLYALWLTYKTIGLLIEPIMIGFFTIFLIQSSIQAITFSQGFFILIVIGLAYSNRAMPFLNWGNK